MNTSKLTTTPGPSSPPPLTTNKVRALLMERGSNLRQFSLKHGYKPRSVQQALERWAGRDSLPLGRLTYRMLQDLSREIGQEIVPGILEEESEH